MKKMTYLFLLAATLGACSPKPENKIETPPKASASLFPQGDAIEGSNFNGTAYLQRLMTDSETFDSYRPFRCSSAQYPESGRQNGPYHGRTSGYQRT